MRISDKIASEIMDRLETEFNIEFNKEEYLDAECVIADTIKTELSKWLSYDVDLQLFGE